MRHILLAVGFVVLVALGCHTTRTEYPDGTVVTETLPDVEAIRAAMSEGRHLLAELEAWEARQAALDAAEAEREEARLQARIALVQETLASVDSEQAAALARALREAWAARTGTD